MTTAAADRLIRCGWIDQSRLSPDDFELYRDYHDNEWGRPLHGSTALFERVTLEAFQSGLSWLIILRKRDNFRSAFAGFDVERIARYTERDVERLMADPGIVRNRLKIESAISNAKAFLEVQREFGTFDRYVWSFVRGKPLLNRRRSMKTVPARTPESDALSKDLQKRGFRFVGTTIIYAFMQATGLVNDHLVACPRWIGVQDAKAPR